MSDDRNGITMSVKELKDHNLPMRNYHMHPYLDREVRSAYAEYRRAQRAEINRAIELRRLKRREKVAAVPGDTVGVGA